MTTKRSPYADAAAEASDGGRRISVKPSKRSRRRPGGSDAAGLGASAVVPQDEPRVAMSMEVLEQKKMLLPYLDKIEYINYQLRQRGLIPEEASSTANETKKPQPSPAPSWEERAHVSRAPTDLAPPPSQSVKPPPIGRAKRPSPSKPSTSVALLPTGAAHNQEPFGSDLEAATKKIRLSNELLAMRYPRVCASIDTLSRRIARSRPINWLLRLIEDMYDAMTEVYLVGAPNGSPRPESAGDRSLAAQISTEISASRNSSSATLAMPLFARRFILHSLGLVALADQDCLDLIYNVEMLRETFPQVALFGSFMRELFDHDSLVFYLMLRHAAQTELDLQLKNKEKQAHSSLTSAAKKFMSPDMYELVAHPHIPDGTKQVLLSQTACENALRRLFTDYRTGQQQQQRPIQKARSVVAPGVLSQFLAREKMRNAFAMADRSLLTIEEVMDFHVQLFREVPEDIVAQFKYNDDGESLTSLIRLRDTISSDAKIEQLMARYSEQERTLRNLKVELMKMERSNAENQFRTQICLVTNRIRLQEQELQHIQSKIATTEGLVNDVWTDVLKTPTPVPANSVTPQLKELVSVLGRFECYITRLQRKHDIEVRASELLARSWKQQMEELKTRMIIRIQRAYRARKRARAIKQQAMNELHEQVKQREIKVKQEQMQNRRHEAMLEKEMQRHRARLETSNQQDMEKRARHEEKQKERMLKLRDEEIAQRSAQRQQQLKASMLKQWRAFAHTRRQKWKANKLFVKFKFLKWKIHFAQFQRRKQAAIVIQRCARHRRERIEWRKVTAMSEKRNKIARKYLQRVRSRLMVKLFSHWRAVAIEQLHLKSNFEAIFQKRVATWFQQWVRFVELWKAKTLASVLLIQRVYRGRIARQVFRLQQKRHHGALCIQRVFRGHQSRLETNMRRQIVQRQELGCGQLLRRLRNRQVYACFSMLQLYAERQRTIAWMAARRRHQCQLIVLNRWVHYRLYKQQKRQDWIRKQNHSATVIQRNFLRHRCQQIFSGALVLHRASIKIQRVYRGFRGREYAKRCRWERNAAILVQTTWRTRRAMRLAETMRTQSILLAAFKGDYTSTKRSIANGYGYVVDPEGNGILHMAAAAGHKRLIKLCIRNSMDVNMVNYHCQTPLHLLLANIPPNSPGDESDLEARSIREERIALADYMIDHGAWHEAPDEDHFTPLLLCSSLGQTEVVELLLERVADTNARSLAAGLNAAQLAMEGNYHETLRVLLASRGFDFEQNGKDTVNMLHACAGRGLIDCLRVLVAHITTFFAASILDTHDDEGYTPLIYAVSNGCVDIVQCLLENGASPDEKDYFGRSPLHFALAVRENHLGEAIVKLLTMYDADVNMKDTDGDAPLHVSSDNDDRLSCTALLLKSGAMLCSNALGNHPTHVAALHGAVATLRLLMEYGGDMNLKNYDGKTPLGMARMYNQRAVVQYIVHNFAQDDLAAVEGRRADGDQQPENSDEPVVDKHAEDMDGDPADNIEDDNQDEDTLQDSVTQKQQPRTMTEADWQQALASGYWMGTVAEWTQYIDVRSEFPFYCCAGATPEAPMVFTWDPPIEFEAVLGEDWQVIRVGGSGVHRRFSHHQSAAELNGLQDDDNAAPTPAARIDQSQVHFIYHNRATDELRNTVPPMDYSLLQDIVQQSKRHKILRARVHRVSAADTAASSMEYMRYFHNFVEESAQTRAEIHGAIKIQRHFRARRTLKLIKALLHENRCASDLQRAFRGRKARRLAAWTRRQHAEATRIQAWWHGFSVRRQERSRLHAERVEHRRRRMAAHKIQCLFRGYRARRLFYREKVVQTLGPHGYFEWEALRQRAVRVNSFKVWDEMEARAQFPGVYFYCHKVTRSCAWDKPKEWQAFDHDGFEERCQLVRWGYTQAMKQSAIRLQRLWRARQARISFRIIMKSVHLMQSCEQDYLEDPTNLVKMGNYVLYLHTIVHDYERARPLYGRLMRMMATRGPDIAFILFSYGLFLYVTQEDDLALVEEMIVRGKAKDPQLTKYKSAFLGFFRQSMVQNPFDGESNLNYAACLQWLFEQYDEAAKYYLRAIAANPHKKGTMELFQAMLDRKRQVDTHANRARGKPKARSPQEQDEERAQYDSFEVFRRWQRQQADADDLARRRAFETEKEEQDRLRAAKMIQTRFRRRRAMRQVNRAKNAKQLAASMADLARQKLFYDQITLAMDKLTLGPSSQQQQQQHSSILHRPKIFGGGNAGAPKKPLSVPVAQLEALLQNLQITISPEELQETAMQFRHEHPSMRQVSVLDLCQFAQDHPLLSERMATHGARTKASQAT